MTIKETSYKDERLGFFADQRKLVQKRYDRLEKAIKPDEPYMSERRQFLSDCGRELSFYNDVIEMLENDVVPKSAVELYQRLNAELEQELATTYDKLEDTKSEVEKIFEEIEKLMSDNYHQFCDDEYNYYDKGLADDIADLKKEIYENL